MLEKKVHRPFGVRDKVGYMFGDFGCNMSFQLITAYLMLFVTQGLGISPIGWATIVIIAKIFDAINDPIIGAIVDSTRPSRIGKFKPWIFWGSFAIAITTTLLFVDVSSFPYASKFAYVLVMYMVWSIAYTAANVPYGSLNAVLTDDPGQRASLSSLRSIGAGVAMLPIMIAMPLIVYNEGGSIKPGVFVWVAMVAGVVGILGFMLTVFLTEERLVKTTGRVKFNYLATLKGFFKNRAILALCLASFAQLVFILTYSITFPLVFQFYFRNTKLISVASVLLMFPMMLFIPFISKLSVRFGTKEISAMPNILSIIVLMVMLFLPFPRTDGGAWMYTIMYMVAMLGGGTFMLTTWSMVADAVDSQEIATGRREEASVYATYSLARKIAQGVGASLVALLLSAVGYMTEGMSQSELVEYNSSEGVSMGILRLSILLPLIGFVVVFLVMTFMYNLSKKKVMENTTLLRAMHGETYIDTSPTRLFYESGARDTSHIAMGAENIELMESADTFIDVDDD